MAVQDQYTQEYLKTQRRRGGLDRRYQVATPEQASQQASAVFDQFSGLFQNLVGRAPTEDEFGKYYSQVLTSSKDFGSVLTPGASEGTDPTELRDLTTRFISDRFQREAEAQAQQELQGQEAEAGRLSDLFRTQGRQAISDTQSQLMDYQQRLFEKLRPNLITSLQAQGLLNTGGLNEALAGAQGDLAAAGQESLREQTLANEQQANAIRFGGAAAPYEFKVGQIMGRPGQFQAAGAGAIDRAFQTYMSNLETQNKMRLLGYHSKLQQDAEPGLLGRLGQNFVTSFGTQAGESLGSWLGPKKK